MAMPPSCAAENPESAPESLPMGVRAPARITEPAIKGTPQGVERVRRFYGAPVAPPIGLLLGSRSLARPQARCARVRDSLGSTCASGRWRFPSAREQGLRGFFTRSGSLLAT